MTTLLIGGGADVLAAAVYRQMTVTELAELDLSYAPMWDPLPIAANQAVKAA